MTKHLSERMKDGFILAVLAAFFGGSTPVAGKIALEVFHPFTVITIRFFFASLFLLPFVYKRRELSTKLFFKLSKVAVIGALNPILFFIALPFTKASVSPLIYACVPALTVLYLYITQKQTISQKQLIGILLGFFGVAVIILLPLLERGHGLSAFYGNVLIFVAAIAFMIYGVVSKKHLTALHASPLALTFYFSVMSLLISLPFTVNEFVTYGISESIQIRHLFSGVYVGVFGTGLFYLAYQYALKLSSELAAALFTYLQPIATILLASIFLGEKITLLFVAGGFLAVVGARIAAKKN